MIKLLFSALFLSAVTLSAGAQADFSAITINKKVQPGLKLDLPNNSEVAEGTILQKLKETGYTPETSGAMFWKKNKQDKFYVFNGVQLPSLNNNQKLDLYFRVDKKTGSEKGQSVMYMLVSKGYDNFVSPEQDSVIFSAATEFLNGFLADNASFSLEKSIETQEKVLANAEKKLSSLEGDDKDMLKKMEQLRASLQNNKSDREVQAREIATQKDILDRLKAQRN